MFYCMSDRGRIAAQELQIAPPNLTLNNSIDLYLVVTSADMGPDIQHLCWWDEIAS